MLREKENKSHKIRKILGRIWTAPKRIFETFLHSRTTGCIGMNAIQKIKQRIFSYTIFPVNKINVGKNLKL
jgi:hypothetical protein